MAAKWTRPGFRVAFWIYAAGLLCWLGLGLLAVAARSSVLSDHLGSLGDRIMHADMADLPSPWVIALQYAFSVLNLVLGLLLAIRRGDERVPRLLAFALLGTAATFNMPSHVVFHILGSPWPIALTHFTFHIVSGVCYLWAVVLFPDGLLPRRIRLRGRALAGVVVAVTVAVVLICWRSSFLAHPQFFVIFFGILVPVAGVTCALLRLTDPQVAPMERRTSRLLLAALLPAFGVALVWLGARAVALSGGRLASDAASFAVGLQDVFPAAFAIVPVVLAAGVVRYRLWDIDRLLSRVLTYLVIVFGAGAVYVAVLAAVGSVAGGGWVVVAVAAAAVVVEPVRTAAHGWANRVVYGQRLSPTEAMRTLISGLGRLTPSGELAQLTAVTVAATRAQAAALWMQDGDRLVLAAATPATSDAIAPADLGMTYCVPVLHAGDRLGVLGVRAEGLHSRDAALIDDVAAHAGLLVHNALLTVQLARHVAELAERTEHLRIARRRLVAAQDEQRRSLERDLHDGAQQALVATIIGLRTLTANGASTGELTEWRAVLTGARDSLAAVCAANEPAQLTREGLTGALARAVAVARRSGPEIALDVDLPGEPEPVVRTAVYFCVLEALQNAAKHAHPSRVTVRIDHAGDELRFEVADDGVGFVPNGSGNGGLGQLGDRLSPLGGWLDVVSAPGSGTRVLGLVPVGAAAVSAGV
jgi:signal transduction histidine kinase